MRRRVMSATIVIFCVYVGMLYGESSQMNVHGLILAGGVGERLWPLSRIDHPKQFLSVGSLHTLLEQSIERLRGVIPPENMKVVTSHMHAAKVRETSSVKEMIIEPASRNTGPAVLLSCLELHEKDPNAIAVFVPADPYIPESDYACFRKYLHQAILFSQEHQDRIILFGVKPTHPATGYGYIEYNQGGRHNQFFPVTRFHEKPSLPLAKNYVQQPDMLWNICMFIGPVATFINEFKAVAPDLYAEVIAFRAGTQSYAEVTSISIDCAVMERSNNVWVLPVDFSWCDVGNVETFLSIKEKATGAPSNVISVESNNNLIEVPHKLVALVGVDDLCVVETPDALLITKRQHAEKVRIIVQQLKKTEQIEYL